jgi:hypothetical protein
VSRRVLPQRLQAVRRPLVLHPGSLLPTSLVFPFPFVFSSSFSVLLGSCLCCCCLSLPSPSLCLSSLLLLLVSACLPSCCSYLFHLLLPSTPSAWISLTRTLATLPLSWPSSRSDTFDCASAVIREKTSEMSITSWDRSWQRHQSMEKEREQRT